MELSEIGYRNCRLHRLKLEKKRGIGRFSARYKVRQCVGYGGRAAGCTLHHQLIDWAAGPLAYCAVGTITKQIVASNGTVGNQLTARYAIDFEAVIVTPLRSSIIEVAQAAVNWALASYCLPSRHH